MKMESSEIAILAVSTASLVVSAATLAFMLVAAKKTTVKVEETKQEVNTKLGRIKKALLEELEI